MPIEHPLVFYPKYAAEIAEEGQQLRLAWSGTPTGCCAASSAIRTSVTYTAISPSRRRKPNELETLAMFHETSGGEAAVAKKRREDDLREVAKLHAAE